MPNCTTTGHQPTITWVKYLHFTHCHSVDIALYSISSNATTFLYPALLSKQTFRIPIAPMEATRVKSCVGGWLYPKEGDWSRNLTFSAQTNRPGEERGATALPNFEQLRFFRQQEEIWAKPVFKNVSMIFYFEEINIFFFNLQLA